MIEDIRVGDVVYWRSKRYRTSGVVRDVETDRVRVDYGLRGDFTRWLDRGKILSRVRPSERLNEVEEVTDG